MSDTNQWQGCVEASFQSGNDVRQMRRIDISTNSSSPSLTATTTSRHSHRLQSLCQSTANAANCARQRDDRRRTALAVDEEGIVARGDTDSIQQWASNPHQSVVSNDVVVDDNNVPVAIRNWQHNPVSSLNFLINSFIERENTFIIAIRNTFDDTVLVPTRKRSTFPILSNTSYHVDVQREENRTEENRTEENRTQYSGRGSLYSLPTRCAWPVFQGDR